MSSFSPLRTTRSTSYYSVCLFLAGVILVQYWNASPTRAGAPPLWYYAHANLNVDRNDEQIQSGLLGTLDLIDLFSTLRESGYTVVILASWELNDFHFLENEDSTVIKNLKRVVKAANQSCIEIIPEVMPVGSSGSMLINDRRFAEAFPVLGAEFQVAHEDGRLFADIVTTQNAVPGGDLNLTDQEFRRLFNASATAGEFSPRQDPANSKESRLVYERKTDESGQTSANPGSFDIGTLTDEATHPIKLKPYQQYLMKFSMKTDGLQLDPDGGLLYTTVMVNDSSHGSKRLHSVGLEYMSSQLSKKQEEGFKTDFGFKPTQDWKTYVISFNSLNYSKAQVWIGGDKINAGKVTIDNISIHPSGAINLLRRDDLPGTDANEGLPISISTIGGEKLVECEHFSRWEDKQQKDGGIFPHRSKPTRIELKPTEKVKPGDRLLVSYYHAQCLSNELHRVSVSLRHPQVFKWFGDQVRLLRKYIAPKRWLILHDELRMVGHDPLGAGDSPAQMLGENLNRCREIIGDEAPGDDVIVVSDMYDRGHNALSPSSSGSYFPAVDGTFAGTWDYLEPTDLIWNWSMGEKRIENNRSAVEESFRFFNERVHSQIVGGYYDVPTSAEETLAEATELFRLAKANGRIKGLCFYSTKGETDRIKQFAEAARVVWPIERGTASKAQQ